MLSGKPSEVWNNGQVALRPGRRARQTSAETQRRLPLWLQVDPFLAFLTLALLVIGLVMVHSSSSALSMERDGSSVSYFRVQFVAAILGLIGAFGAMRVPMTFYSRHAKHLVWASVALMLLVFVPGISLTVGGFHRWLRFPFFAFQPVEVAKFAVIVYVAYFLSSGTKSIQSLMKGVAPNLIVMTMFVGLLLIQPDFGSALLICGTVFAMLLAGGARISHLVILGLMAAVPGYLLIVTDAYRYQRVMSFVQWIWGTAPVPDEKGYQIWQSYNALSSGGLIGVGLGESIHKLFYLPTPHTDFIFAILGEELGFLGAAAVILLYALFVMRGLHVALRVRDPFMQMLAFGISISLGLQAIVNIGMVLGLLPTKGFTLPFLSYGGSSLLTTLVGVGVLLNISRYAFVNEKV